MRLRLVVWRIFIRLRRQLARFKRTGIGVKGKKYLEFIIEYLKGASLALIALLFRDGASIAVILGLIMTIVAAIIIKIVVVEIKDKEDKL
jgi:hypothetical protein